MSRTIISNLNGTGIKVYGKIPYDETMMFALLKGKAVNEFKPSGTAASELNRIWKTIKETVS